MRKNLLIGSILLIIGIVLMLIFSSDFIVMAFLWPSVLRSTMVMGTTIFLIGIVLIFMAFRFLMKDFKRANLYTGISFILMSSVLIIIGFFISEDLFLLITLWNFSIFANILAEEIIAVGTLGFFSGLLILFKDKKKAKLMLGLFSILLGILLFILGIFFIIPIIPLFLSPLLAILIGFVQGYFSYGIALIIIGIIITIKRKKE